MTKNAVNHDIVLAILYWFKSKDHIKSLTEMLAKTENIELMNVLE